MSVQQQKAAGGPATATATAITPLHPSLCLFFKKKQLEVVLQQQSRLFIQGGAGTATATAATATATAITPLHPRGCWAQPPHL